MKFTEKEIDGKLWICDKDKNMASVEKWGSKEGAEKALASLVDCTDCNNCYNCDNCDNSSYCNNCYNCNDCHDCHDCANCNTCTGCTYTHYRENYHRQEKEKAKATPTPTPTIAIMKKLLEWLANEDNEFCECKLKYRDEIYFCELEQKLTENQDCSYQVWRVDGFSPESFDLAILDALAKFGRRCWDREDAK